MTEDIKAQEPARDELRPQLIKIALELGPLLVFFLVNARGDIYVGTAAFMAAMVLSLILSWLLLKRVAIMPLVTAVVVLIFGGLTLLLHDEIFIKIKPTVLNTLFGGVLLGGLLFHQSLLKYVFGDVYKLEPKGWSILTWRWGLFFLAMAVLNEIVWRGAAFYLPARQATDFWVTFKAWANIPITVLFAMTQMGVLAKYSPDKKVHEVVPPMDPLP